MPTAFFPGIRKQRGQVTEGKKMRYFMSNVALVFLFVLADQASAERTTQSFIYSVYSEKVEIQVVEAGSNSNLIKVNNKIIYKDDESTYLNIDAFIKLYDGEGNDLLLVSGAVGESGTGTNYRIVQIKLAEQAVVTQTFGNGSIPMISIDSSKGKVTFDFPKGPSKMGVGARNHHSERWVFEKGALIKAR
jgi:hypothetical protein